MILYHGSYTEVKKPDIFYSRDNLDFGKGFYTTPIYEQAKSWSNRFKTKKGSSVISFYEINEDTIRKEALIKEFIGYTEEWLDFIISCRKGEYKEPYKEPYDVVIGGVANDKVFDTIELFFEGLLDKYVAIDRLRYEKPNLQVCFRSQGIINKYLKYQKCEVL